MGGRVSTKMLRACFNVLAALREAGYGDGARLRTRFYNTFFFGRFREGCNPLSWSGNVTWKCHFWQFYGCNTRVPDRMVDKSNRERLQPLPLPFKNVFNRSLLGYALGSGPSMKLREYAIVCRKIFNFMSLVLSFLGYLHWVRSSVCQIAKYDLRISLVWALCRLWFPLQFEESMYNRKMIHFVILISKCALLTTDRIRVRSLMTTALLL